MSGRRPFRTYDLIDSITKRALRQGDRLPQCDLQERYARDNARSPAVTAAIDRARSQGRLIYPRVDSGRQLPTSATRPMLDSYVPGERRRTPLRKERRSRSPSTDRRYSRDYRLIDSYVPRRNRSRSPVARGRDSSRGRRRSSMNRSVSARHGRSRADRRIPRPPRYGDANVSRPRSRSPVPRRGNSFGDRSRPSAERSVRDTRQRSRSAHRQPRHRSRPPVSHRRDPSGDRPRPSAGHTVSERRQRSRSADRQVARQPKFRYFMRGELGTTPPLDEHMSRWGLSKKPPTTNAACESASVEQGALDALLMAIEPGSTEEENSAALDDGQDFVRFNDAAAVPKLAFEPSSPQQEDNAAPDDGQDCQIQ